MTPQEKAAAKRKRKAERQNPPPSKYACWNASVEAEEYRSAWNERKTVLGELDDDLDDDDRDELDAEDE